MLLLTDQIKEEILKRGFAEAEGTRLRAGWPRPRKEGDVSVEDRVQHWAARNGWTCQWNESGDVYTLRNK